jgi:hypothetical protein
VWNAASHSSSSDSESVCLSLNVWVIQTCLRTYPFHYLPTWAQFINSAYLVFVFWFPCHNWDKSHSSCVLSACVVQIVLQMISVIFTNVKMLCTQLPSRVYIITLLKTKIIKFQHMHSRIKKIKYKCISILWCSQTGDRP